MVVRLSTGCAAFRQDPRRIEVWCWRTEALPAVVTRFESVLSPAEMARAARFRLEKHRAQFALAHGVLRMLLGGYLKRPPSEVIFQFGSGGKPSLAGQTGIDFNLSHSDGLAVLAVTPNCDLGVDIERIHSMPDQASVANQYFHSDEADELASLPEEERERAFFLCWTRKEAYLKATGAGLSVPLCDFRVTLRPREPARFLHFANSISATAEWTLQNLELAPGYAAAIAYRDRPRPIECSPLLNPADLELPE